MKTTYKKIIFIYSVVTLILIFTAILISYVKNFFVNTIFFMFVLIKIFLFYEHIFLNLFILFFRFCSVMFKISATNL